MKSIKYLTLLIPAALFLFLEYFIGKPKLIFLATKQFLNPFFFAILLAIILVIIFFVAARRSFANVTYADLLFPINLELSFLVYMIIQTERLYLQALVVANVIILYLYFRLRLLTLASVEKEFQLTYSNIISFGNFLVIFFYSSSLYRMPYFVKLSLWQLAAFFIIGTGLAIYETYKIYGIDDRSSVFYTFFALFILTELAWTLSFLPLKYNSLGLVLSLGYYVIQGATKLQFANNLKLKNLKSYLTISISSVIIILLTSRWL